jgi:hypothetical protein
VEHHASSIAEARSLKPALGQVHTSVIDMAVNREDEVFGTRRVTQATACLSGSMRFF